MSLFAMDLIFYAISSTIEDHLLVARSVPVLLPSS